MQTKLFEPQPANKLYKLGDVIQFRLDAARSCYLYMLYKGTSNQTPSTCIDGGSAMLALGDTRFWPPSVGATVSGPPGTDTVMVIASGQPLDILNTESRLARTFEYGQRLVGENTDGVEIPLKCFLDEIGLKSTSDNPNALVYINTTSARH